MTLYVKLISIGIPDNAPKPTIYNVELRLDDKSDKIKPQKVSEIPISISLKSKVIKINAPETSIPVLAITHDGNIIALRPFPPKMFTDFNATVHKKVHVKSADESISFKIELDACYITKGSSFPDKKTSLNGDICDAALNHLKETHEFFKTSKKSHRGEKHKEESERDSEEKKKDKKKKKSEKDEIQTLRRNPSNSKIVNSFETIRTRTSSATDSAMEKNITQPEFSYGLFFDIVNNIYKNCDEQFLKYLEDPQIVTEACERTG